MSGLKYIKVDKITGKKVVVELKDVSPYWLYDTKVVNQNNKRVSFFQNIDKSDPVSTNMLQNSMLPSGWKFNMLAIRIVPDFNLDATIVASLLYNSIVIFKKESSEIFKAPAYTFPAGGGVNGKPTNGLPSSSALLPLPMQLEIPPMSPFSLDLHVDPALDLSSAGDIKVKAVLDGIVYKNIVSA